MTSVQIDVRASVTPTITVSYTDSYVTVDTDDVAAAVSTYEAVVDAGNPNGSILAVSRFGLDLAGNAYCMDDVFANSPALLSFDGDDAYLTQL